MAAFSSAFRCSSLFKFIYLIGQTGIRQGIFKRILYLIASDNDSHYCFCLIAQV